MTAIAARRLRRIAIRLILAITVLTGSGLAAPLASGAPRYPLSTQGAWIVDRTGAHVRLVSVNWFGAESATHVVGGLDKQPLAGIVKTIKAGGFNAVRLPWSNEMVETNPLVDDTWLTANPDLKGKSALAVFDAVVDALGRAGLMVVLDNHRSRADWCCDEAHGDGLWWTNDYPERAWIADWRFMAARYRDRPQVVAAELRNEIRADPSLGLHPTWGDGDSRTDWRAAAIRGAEAVLAVNSRLLIVVGGVDYETHLTGVRERPVVLSKPHKLVYAAHDYAWDRTTEELGDPTLFAQKSHSRWGFVRDPDQPWTAPVYISEWGGCTQNGPDGQPCKSDRIAFVGAFARYAQDSDIDWAWWPLNGDQVPGYGRSPGAVEPYGLLSPDWKGYARPDLLAPLTGR